MEGGQAVESTLISNTPSRPKRYSPSFDRNDEDWGESEGQRSPLGEGKTMGNLERDMELRLNSPSMAKRRRVEPWDQWAQSNISSCSGTPSRGTTPDTTMEDFSALSTPTDSPAGTLTREERRDFKKRYKKDELWPAIESNYHYLMDEGIIETCKSTDDEDATVTNTKVSFTEFMQQYKELTDWLTQIQVVTQRKGTSRSEKYLNQTYHEELLQSSPRRELFNDYAKQLVKRYPSLKDEINLRMQHLNKSWKALEEAVSPQYGYQDTEAMLNDLELDLSCIKKWLNGVEIKLNLLPLSSVPSWTIQEIEAELKKHQVER